MRHIEAQDIKIGYRVFNTYTNKFDNPVVSVSKDFANNKIIIETKYHITWKHPYESIVVED